MEIVNPGHGLLQMTRALLRRVKKQIVELI
ncbi:hypothetical protein SAMN04490179_0660 [Pseudomonas antarctica]|uniref:Uncharacterized protein n=1 Tax=Pseudomonas antarctica TaxID=219572 RepID=A0A1G9VK89_9PSED|nr:hypothetical protein PSAN_13200 [Pseudomonas antarctica]SDM72589.1 hypothetical protein SAMN04490179_0660 [Pseudomonas antarctica]